jgi:hypothetical protein
MHRRTFRPTLGFMSHQTRYRPLRDRLAAVLGLVLLLTLALPDGFALGQGGDDPYTPNGSLSAEAPLPSIALTTAEAQPSVQPDSEPAAAPSPAPSGIQGLLAPGLDTSFAGTNFDNNPSYNGGYLFIPPDPIAAAGLNHVVSVVNAMIEWRPKSGAAGTIQSLQGFFTSLTPANKLFDPKVIYDQYAGRFVVVALEQVASPTSSRILVAVSDDADPNGTWYYYAINSKTNIGGSDHWADYPGLGLDDKAVYITANMFSFSSNSSGGVRLWIINKTPFYTGGAASVTVHDPYAGGGISTTTQPAHMFGALPANMGTFLVSYSGLSGGGIESVQIVRVDSPLTTPVFTQGYFSLGDIDNTSVTLPGAPQLGSPQTINTNDRRALSAVWRDNALWTTFEILPGSGMDSGQVTAHWVKLNTSNLASLTIADQGNVGGEDIATGTYTFFPSLAVDPCGDMALGFSASAPTIYPGAYYTGRAASDAAGTVQASGILMAGTDWYYRVFSGTRNRWGDYSGISLDPADEVTFWVFNEYAMTRSTTANGGDGRWATQYGSFRIRTAGLDFGDLPSTYGITLRADNGARHCAFPTGLRLGTLIDAEGEAWQSADAKGDDTHASADEDGVTPAKVPWHDGANGGAVNITVSGGSGVLYGWVDWSGNNSFADAGEQIINGAALSAGTTTFSFSIPAGTLTGSATKTFNARFRLYPGAPINPTTAWSGTAPSGEVEDYQWSFIFDLTSTVAGQGINLTWSPLGGAVGHYEVDRSIAPYFLPGDPGVQKLADVQPPASSTNDPNALASPPSAYFYLVQVVDAAAGQAYPASNRTGAFSFVLTRGAP